MPVDPNSFDPISPQELAAIFRGIPVPWWISGGWALDLFLGRQTRPHEDTDVLILRPDQLTVQGYLQRDWQLFKTKQPVPGNLAPWPEGEWLAPPIYDFWVRRDDDAGWAYQVMLLETEGDRWIYRRHPGIGGKIAELGRLTPEGIPYLRPEIQLLYKGRGEYREKDLADLRQVLPALPTDNFAWLLGCLRLQYPQGHGWIGLLEGELSRRRSDRNAGVQPP